MNARKKVSKTKSIKIRAASFFSEKSREYDRKFVSAPSWQLFFKKFFFSRIPKLGKHHLVIDIGCGTGGNTVPLLRHGGRIIGVDISKKMLKLAKKRLKSKANFVIGDAECLPFKTSTFDVVICNGLLQYLPTPCNAIKEVSRILKANGLFFGFETHKSIFRPLYEKLSFLRDWVNPYHTAFSVTQLTNWFKRKKIDVSCKVTLIIPPEVINILYKMNKRLGSFVLLSSEIPLSYPQLFNKLGGGIIITGIKVK